MGRNVNAAGARRSDSRVNGEGCDGLCFRQHCIVQDPDYAISVPPLTKTPGEVER